MPKKSKKTTKKKKVAKKPVKKAKKAKAAKRHKKAKVVKSKTPKPIGRVKHFYGEIKVAVVKFSKPPKIGAEVRFNGATTDFRQVITSAQYDHKPLTKIPKGKQVGVKVRSRVRQGDAVFAAR
jgi:hypothetical protein